jgi:hypothetical protein
MLFESSSTVISNNGSFYLVDKYGGANNGYHSALKGSDGSLRLFYNYGGNSGCAKIANATFDIAESTTNAIVIKHNNVNVANPGSSGTVTPSSTLLNHVLYIGSRSDGSYGLQGNIAEIIAYNRKLSALERQTIYNYLHFKYFSGTGTIQFSSISPSLSSSDNYIDDGTWKHSYNTSNNSYVIASVKDNCLDLGTRSDTVYVEPTAQAIGSAYYMRRHYVVNTSLNPIGTKRVRLYYTNADFADLQIVVPSLTAHNQLCVTKYDGPNEDGQFNSAGGTLTFIPATAITTGTAFGQRYLEFDVDGFSEFWIHTGNTPLPLDLISFTGNLQNNMAQLQWETANMINVKGFDVEKSIDAKSFTSIGFVNASSANAYSFTDTRCYDRNNYYRLKMIDIDGQYTYSKTIKLVNTAKAEITIFPNPVLNELNIICSIPNYTYTILDIYGHEIIKGQSNSSSVEIPSSSLAKGIYVVQIETATERKMIKFVKE